MAEAPVERRNQYSPYVKILRQRGCFTGDRTEICTLEYDYETESKPNPRYTVISYDGGCQLMRYLSQKQQFEDMRLSGPQVNKTDVMNDFTRDLLLVSASAQNNPEELDRQLDMLHAVLFHVENWRSFCTANELIHIHRRRIITQPHKIQAILADSRQKPFVFTFNKN